MATPYYRAAENPAVVARMSELLAHDWDPAGAIRAAAHGGDDYYQEQAVTIVAMLAADARETELQRYLRQVEQQALDASLHPFEERRRIAESAWRMVRGR